MLLGKVGFSHGPTLSLVLTMNALLEPVGDKGSCVIEEGPWARGAFLL